MADEISVVDYPDGTMGQQQTPSEPQGTREPYDRIRFSKEELDDFFYSYKDIEGGPEAILAKTLSNQAATAFPEMFTYEALRSGTHQVPGAEGRKYTNREIIGMLAADSEGNDLDIDVGAGEGFFQGFVRELPAGAAAYKAFGPGYEAGRAWMGGVKPAGELVGNVYKPAKIVTKFGDNLVPITTGLISSAIAAYTAGQASDLVLGEEQPLFGEGRAGSEAGKVLANIAFFGRAPFDLAKAFPEGLDLGALQTVKNIHEIRSLPDQIFKYDSRPLLSLSRSEIAARQRAMDLLQNPSVQSLVAQGYKIRRINHGPNAGQYRAESRISPIKTNVFGVPYKSSGKQGTRISGGLESMLEHWMRGAREYPVRTAITETVVPAGASLGRYLVETDSGGTLNEFGQIEPDTRPAGFGTVLLAETVGGVVPGMASMAVTRRWPEIYKYLKNIYPEYAENRLVGVPRLTAARRAIGIDLKQGTQLSAMTQLREIMKADGLTDDQIDSVFDLGKKKLKELKAEGVDATIGQVTGNPTILAYERLMGDAVLEQAQGAEAAAKQINKNILLTILDTLDKNNPGQAKEGLQLASALMEDGFSASLVDDLERVTANLTKAYDQVRKGTTDPKELANINAKYSKDFYAALEALVEKSKEAQNKAWKDVRNKGTDVVITDFYDSAGNQLDAPNFYKAFVDLVSTTPGVEQAQASVMAPIFTFTKSMANRLGLPDPTQAVGPGGALLPSAPDNAFAAFGKEITDKFSLPDGFRVFQRTDKDVPGVAGSVRVTSVIDKNGNRLELARDPNDRMFPWGAEIINGVADQINKDQKAIVLNANNLNEAVTDAAARMSNPQMVRFNPPVADTTPAASATQAQGPTTGGVTLKELLEIKSEAYDLGKKLKAEGSENKYRIVKDFEYAVLRDIESLKQDPTTQGKDFLTAYNMARALTASHHDVFSRTFLKRFKQTNRTGEVRVDPSLSLKELFGAGGGSADITLMKLGELDKMYAHMAKIGEVGEEVASMEGAMHGYLRNIQANIMDTETGKPNLAKLKEWLNVPENKEILSRFPQLEADLRDIRVANILLSKETKAAEQSAKRNNNLVTFSRIAGEGLFRRTDKQLGAEAPQVVIGRAINDDKPFEQLNRLLGQAELRGLSETQAQSLAEKLGVPFNGIEDLRSRAKAGLEQAVLDYAFQHSGLYSLDNNWNPIRTRQLLFGRIPKGQVSLMEWMLGNKVIDKGKFDRVREVLNSMSLIQSYRASGKDLTDLYSTAGPMMDMYSGIIGSGGATKLQQALFGGVGPGALIAAGKGAEAARQLTIKIPEMMKVNAIQELFENPELFMTVMGRVKNVPRKTLVQRAGNILMDMGIAVPATQATKSATLSETPEAKYEIPEPEIEYDYPQASVQAPQQNLMAQRFARSTPTVIQPRPAAPAPAPAPVAQAPAPQPAPPQGAANPQQRQQLAAMFPNDPILGAAGGIGSLFS